MSFQFGTWNFDSQPVDQNFLERVSSATTNYGPDGSGFYTKDGIGMLYRAFCTTKEARLEIQPRGSKRGNVIMWDGRLDNREELLGLLHDEEPIEETDAGIVVAAYNRWGTACLLKLMGDWAITIWHAQQKTLVLARDFAGPRHLYYSLAPGHIVWSTVLEPLILFGRRSFTLNEQFIAGYLSSYSPAAYLSPYVEIDSVPPGAFVQIRDRKATVQPFWSFDPSKRIRYRTDKEYEEHFRGVFAQSIKRRLRSDFPVLSELSGGMDSSSIVCMSDALIASGEVETPRLDTVSYYDDTEPNWNERPYFTKVEEKRGGAGCHINHGGENSFSFELDTQRFSALPGGNTRQTESARQFSALLNSQGNRVLLSGLGGDEVLGGVPNSVPELADLLTRFHWGQLAHQLKAWSLSQRKPWMHLLFETVGAFLPPILRRLPRHRRPAPWLCSEFVKANRATFYATEDRIRLFGPLPSVQENINTLPILQNQLNCAQLDPDACYETRYPYLDRDLIDFLYAIPRDQLVRPGQRRSLMRRALIGIVPDEILQRKRKAFVHRSLLIRLAKYRQTFTDLSQEMVGAQLGLVDPLRYLSEVHEVCRGKDTSLVPILRTLLLEFWLTGLKGQAKRRHNNVSLRFDKSSLAQSRTIRAQPPQSERIHLAS
jgi:asparagine synthase (glutamine-hydrolysing)